MELKVGKDVKVDLENVIELARELSLRGKAVVD